MKLYLTDENNNKIDLLGETGIWLTDVTGMGAEAEEGYADLSYGFFELTNDRNHPQQSINGTLIFTGENANAAWEDFAGRVLRADELYIAAAPVSDSREYLRRIRVRYMQKDDRKRNYLSVPVSFTCLTPWYERQKLEIGMAPVPTDAARFDEARFDEDVFTASFDKSFTAEIPAAGHLPAALDFSFSGAVENPVLTLRGADTGRLYARCAIAVTLSAGDRLEYSSEPTGCYVRKVTNGTAVDLSGLVSPDADPFALIPVTEGCVLTFDGDEDPDGEATAAVRYYYRSI